MIQQEREGPASEDEHDPSRPTQDLLMSDLPNRSSPPQKRKFDSSPPLPSKKARASPPVAPIKVESRIKVEKHERYDSDEDAKFAAELDQALNSEPRRKTRGTASGTRTKPRAKKVKNGDDGEPKKKRAPNPNNAFYAPMFLSPQLSDVIFETELSRPVRSGRGCTDSRWW